MTEAAAHPDKAWTGSKDIAVARNAHVTNTPAEMLAALQGPYDYLEGDVRMDSRGVVMAHDLGQTSGMTLTQWLQVGQRSGRGLKLDVKEARAIAPILQQVRGIDDARLLLNVTIEDANASSIVSAAQLASLRRAHPQAWINLSVTHFPYDQQVLDRMATVADTVGGPIMFPLRAEFVTPEIVQRLRPHGRVAIWNDPHTFDPTDIAAATARFRGWGVDGMIDLRRPDGH